MQTRKLPHILPPPTRLQAPNKKRLLILASFVFFLFTLLVGQFFRIQISENNKWRHIAQGQHYFDVSEPFIRGTFYANTTLKKGAPVAPLKLAFDIPKYHLYIDPEAIDAKYKEEIAAKILTFVRPTSAELSRYKSQFYKKSRSRKLVAWIDESVKNSLLAWWRPFARQKKIEPNALFCVGDTQRSHPFGKLLGQVMHTVRLQKDDTSYEAYPTGGLELSCNAVLRGKLGKRRLMRSPRHSLETSLVIEKPEHGADVFLTINHCLQAIAEEEVERGVKECGARCGWAVMMEPYTGEILALAQYPFFVPDDYQRYFNDPHFIEDTKVKAITDANEPGSIMKAVTCAIALKANKTLIAQGKKPIFSPTEKIDTSRGSFPGRAGKPLKDTHFHHYLNMYLGLQKSSNIYVATLVHRIINALGANWYRNELERTFGFGIKTGIELPSESSGVLPTPGKTHPNGKLEWSTPTPYSLAMGHNVQATSLQMVRTFAIFANGGTLVQPTLIRKIVSKDKTLIDNTPQARKAAFPHVLDADIIREVHKGMKFVTKRGGSAPLANIWGYTEAGKTGTSEKIVGGTYSKEKNVTTFVGFAPVEKPAFVLLVCMDEPKVCFIPGKGFNQRGGLACGPVFREIGRRTLEYLGTPPDDPHGYPKSDPRYDPKKADWIDAVEKAEMLYKEWNENTSINKTHP